MFFFATAAKGTEGALRDELRELRFRGVRATRGGVEFQGEWEEGFRACLELRIALRVLVRLGEFGAEDERALYEGVGAIDWTPLLTSGRTLAVRAAGATRGLTHTQFVARRTKDAVVDQLRSRFGTRPSVELDDPDVTLFVHLRNEHATVYADLSGESLHRRGYRFRVGEAPLKETLAAAMLRLSGWDRESPLLDPMCGAGTIALEAAFWSRRIAPGLARARFGIERWALWDDALARRAADLRSEARDRALSTGPEIVASDNDPEMVDTARANARAANVAVVLRTGDVRAMTPSRREGWLVTNPPYGERLASSFEFYSAMARSLRRLEQSTLAILSGTPTIRRAMGAPPTRWVGLMNGALPCELLVYVQGQEKNQIQ